MINFLLLELLQVNWWWIILESHEYARDILLTMNWLNKAVAIKQI